MKSKYEATLSMPSRNHLWTISFDFKEFLEVRVHASVKKSERIMANLLKKPTTDEQELGTINYKLTPTKYKRYFLLIGLFTIIIHYYIVKRNGVSLASEINQGIEILISTVELFLVKKLNLFFLSSAFDNVTISKSLGMMLEWILYYLFIFCIMQCFNQIQLFEWFFKIAIPAKIYLEKAKGQKHAQFIRNALEKLISHPDAFSSMSICTFLGVSADDIVLFTFTCIVSLFKKISRFPRLLLMEA